MSLSRWDSADFQLPVLISAAPHRWKVTGEILCPTVLIALRFLSLAKKEEQILIPVLYAGLI